MILMCLNVQAGADLPDSLQVLLDRATTDSARINTHIRIANALINTNYRKSLEHATLAVRLSEEQGEYRSMIESYRVAGTICSYKGLYDPAVQFFNREFDLAKQQGNSIDAGTAYFNLGGIYLMLTDYRKAGQVFNDAYHMLEAGYQKKKSVMPELTRITFLMNMAIIHWHEGDIPQADSMLNLSKLLVQGRPDMEHKLMSIYHINALLDIKRKQPKVALANLDLSRALAIKLNSLPGIAITYLTAGDAFERIGDVESAKTSYTKGFVYANQYNGLADQIGFAQSLYKLYKKSGPSDSMVKYFDLYTALSEKSKTQQAKEELMRADLMRDYDRMVQDWERQQQHSKKQNIFLSIILGLASIIATVTYVKYRNRNRKMRFERVRRDLEERKSRFEQLRLQAELDQRVTELEEIKASLRNQQILEGLVSGLDPVKKDPSNVDVPLKTLAGTSSERKAKAWEEFEYRFQQLHSGFYDRLNQRFPELTINERRLCAFLKLDMTTKEISDITGQTVRAVKMARIRLRNKLGITHTDTELFAFLSNL